LDQLRISRVSRTDGQHGRTLLFIDMAYSLAEVQRRAHFQFFEARHSGDYFDKVIGLHPLADLVTKLDAPVERKRFTDRQEIIEARSAALPLPKWLRPLNIFLTQRRLLKHVAELVRKENVGLIAATGVLYSGLFAYWLRRRTGVPVVLHLVSSHNLDVGTPLIKKLIIRFTLTHADLVAAGSETLRDWAIAQGVRPENATVFRVFKNMVPAHRVDPQQRPRLSAKDRERIGISGASKLLLTVARLEPVKWVDDSIRAFSIVLREHRDALLLLAGDGSDRPRLEALAAELGIAGQVRFLGLVDQDFLSRLEPGCLTLSPITGMALFETSMAGSPAVAYDCDTSVTELIETGVTGVVVPTREWKAMGKAASELLSDPAKLERLSTAIRRRAEAITDLAALYAQEHAAFDQLLGTGSRAAEN
jgi:glycosyltransferase involved in cell wall biosynthesis